MSSDLHKYTIEGNKLFEYMITNFNTMFEKETIIHFDIRYASWDMFHYSDEINEKYNILIQKDVIEWIKNIELNSLYKLTNWMPIRDSYLLTDIYLAYKKLFLYDHYYFQLAIVRGFWEHDTINCNHCNNNMNSIHFELKLYGLVDDIVILSDID